MNADIPTIIIIIFALDLIDMQIHQTKEYIIIIIPYYNSVIRISEIFLYNSVYNIII